MARTPPTPLPTDFHVPVLLDEVLQALRPAPGMTMVDATLGGGGHSRALAERLAPGGHLVAFDRDPEAIAAARPRLDALDCRVDILNASFAELDTRLRALGLRPTDDAERRGEPDTSDRESGLDGLLADLGVSSHQLDTPQRGFSFADPTAALDMRMGPDTVPAAELLPTLDPETLAEALIEGGDVPRARHLARIMIEEATAGRLTTVGELVSLCERVLPRKPPGKRRIHPATTVFQAVRILVNRELDALDQLLEAAPRWLKPGGRLAVISFHSGEDRRVKVAMRRWAGRAPRPHEPWLRHLPLTAAEEPAPLGHEVTRKPIVASEAELARNPRARSAKLRVFERAH